VSGRIELWHLFAISAVFGAGQAFQGPAAGAIVPDLVPRDLLVQANSLSYALTSAPWQAMAISFVGEACWAGGLLVWITLMQRVVPTELLGRVKSVDWLLSTGLVPLSYAVTGPAAAWLGVQTVLLGSGIVASVLTALFFFLPGMRDTETPGHTSRVILSEPIHEPPHPLDALEPGMAPVQPPPG
jgi:hypothetical protein